MNDKWKPIEEAPKDATEIRVRLKDGTIYEKAHFACDLSGEDQPAFRGWFIDSSKNSYREIETPIEWQDY